MATPRAIATGGARAPLVPVACVPFQRDPRGPRIAYGVLAYTVPAFMTKPTF